MNIAYFLDQNNFTITDVVELQDVNMVIDEETNIEINPLKYNLDGTGRKQAIFFERKYGLAFFFNCYEYEVIQIF